MKESQPPSRLANLSCPPRRHMIASSHTVGCLRHRGCVRFTIDLAPFLQAQIQDSFWLQIQVLGRIRFGSSLGIRMDMVSVGGGGQASREGGWWWWW